MTNRFTKEHVKAWREEGAVVIPEFFKNKEVEEVAKDFEIIFPGRKAEAVAKNKKAEGEVGNKLPLQLSGKKMGRTTAEQFKNFENIPFNCSSALNLISVHPSLIDFARAALGTNDVRLYQAQAWAKFTGEADFDQAFHCDFGNHTLTVPSNEERLNSITFIIYFTDVTEAHGPTHYVNRTDSKGFEGIERFLKSREDIQQQQELKTHERSSAGPAGTLLAYGIDIFHRGTNLTEPEGFRYAMTSCFKKAGNDTIGYTAWPWHFNKPWHNIFEHATPDQLNCFGVPLPGDSFWTKETLSLAQLRYPNWDMSDYSQSKKFN
tara:strand:- start:485 stop:1444 length:960 start_codon:yes stop_codon:yes gene_type:complete